MKFKVGDKVKIQDSSKFKKGIRDTVGVVKEVCGATVLVKWRTKGCVVCGIETPCKYPENTRWFKSYEIEHAVKGGEQLLFSFMEK